MSPNSENTALDPSEATHLDVDPAQLFAIGRHHLSKGQYREALVALKQATELELGEASYQSYYGLCLVQSGRGRKEGLGLCRQALQRAFYDVDLYVNLAKAHLASRERGRAVAVLKKAASLERGNEVVERLLSDVGRRRRPVFPFLRRRHPINRIAGRIRHAVLGACK
jgi:Flp pilus assembly protein TadD